MDAALVLAERARRDPVVELVGVEDPLLERLLERPAERRARGPGGKPQADDLAAAGGDLEDIAGRGLRPGLLRVHGVALPGDDVAMERVLDVRRRIRLAPEPLEVALVLGEQELRGAVARERVIAQLGMGRRDRPADLAEDRFGALVPPRPGVPEPERRQDVDSRRLRTAVVDRHANQDVVRSRLGVFEEDVEVPVILEDPRVEQLVLELFPRPPPVRLEEIPVGELALRILVEVLHVRVGRRRVEVEVVLLDVLSVVPLAVGEPEHALLQDRVPLVPQREGETETLLVVGEPAEAVLAPPVGPGTGLVVREVVPGVAVLAVVLADRPPLPLAQVRAPLLPRDPLLPSVVQPFLFGGVDEPRVLPGLDHGRLLAAPRSRVDRFARGTASVPGASILPARNRDTHDLFPPSAALAAGMFAGTG